MGEALIVRRGGGNGGISTETIKDWTILADGASLNRSFSINLAGRSLIGIGEIRIKGGKDFNISTGEITLDFDVPELNFYLITSGYTSTARFDYEVDLLFVDSTGDNTLRLLHDDSEWIYTLPKNKFSANTTFKFK